MSVLAAAAAVFCFYTLFPRPPANNPPATTPTAAPALQPAQSTTAAVESTSLVMPATSLPPKPARQVKRPKPPAQDPGARAALSLVGADPTAEVVWASAINNPALPAQERQDLIEDLNEDGFSNKKHPTSADLPLIKARLSLIERLAPEAMDRTNAEAFAEARKDLADLLTKLEP